MTKVILNDRYGGYCWSEEAYAEYLRRKGIENDEDMYIDERRIPRTDPVAVTLLEEKGSEWCSSTICSLVVDEYDEHRERADIHSDDGLEWLVTTPLLTEDMVKKCGSVQEVVCLLMACDAFVYPNEQLMVPD